MKIAVFDTHKFDRQALEAANLNQHELIYFDVRLTSQTAILAKGCDVACCFANDRADGLALKLLKEQGVRLVALRSAGFNQVDMNAARALNLPVVRVPEYSPYAVAEFAVGLLLTLNRKIHKSYNRVHEMNFSLDGLVGFDLHQKTIGVIGTGKIGKVFAKIMNGFGCKVIAFDRNPDHQWAKSNDVTYVGLETLQSTSNVISLHVPLNGETKYILNQDAFCRMQANCIVINTGRGALVDTTALISSLKSHRIGGACLDVYEEEAGVFFSDLSEAGIDDDRLARLLTFPNVLITSHQAFLTAEALENIAVRTIKSVSIFEHGGDLSDVLVKID